MEVFCAARPGLEAGGWQGRALMAFHQPGAVHASFHELTDGLLPAINRLLRRHHNQLLGYVRGCCYPGPARKWRGKVF
jgi:hypothetical protein